MGSSQTVPTGMSWKEKYRLRVFFGLESPKRIGPEIEIQNQVVWEMRMGKGVNGAPGRHLVIKDAVVLPAPTLSVWNLIQQTHTGSQWKPGL